jgi:uncharacterized protein YggU (UPF0235/DUF167 family)
VLGRHGSAWKVSVAAAPTGGRANDALVALLANELAVRRPDVRIVSGRASRDKVVELRGIGLEEAERRLAASGKEGS